MVKSIMEYNDTKWRHKLMIGVATEGWVRFEWAHNRYSMPVPINWQAVGYEVNYSVLGHGIADAYNLMTKQLLLQEAEWLLIIEDDVIVPPDTLMRMNEYIQDPKIPIVSGLYFSKGNPSEPLIFRGRGNGCFYKWKRGDRVWCDGVPMGLLLIHSSILRAAWDESVDYLCTNGEQTRKVFETPKRVEMSSLNFFSIMQGTQDLYFCDRLRGEGGRLIKKAGWPKIARKKYPFLVDTGIFCMHIDRGSGRQYPLNVKDVYKYEVRKE